MYDLAVNREYARRAYRQTEVSLNEGELHVWSARLHAPDRTGTDKYRSVLSPDEIERAQRLKPGGSGDKFAASRAILREILGLYLNVPPGELKFEYGPGGKPSLPAPLNNREIKFNLSHSNELALIAVTANREVGIDVEYLRDVRNPGEIVKRFFSPDDVSYYGSLGEDRRNEEFFRMWTFIEACAKAKGDGIFSSRKNSVIRSISVSRMLSDKDGKLTIGEGDYSLVGVEAGEGYTGAAAVEGTVPELKRFEYDTDV